MRTAIKRIRIISFSLIIIQMVLIILFSVLYFTNLFDVQTNINPSYVIIVAVSLVFVDTVFVWASIMQVSSIRQKTNLHAADVIGSDVQEAYNFAMLGLAVVDENNMVLWTNDLFKDRHIDIIDANIIEWQTNLMTLKESSDENATVKVVINSRNYEVKLLAEAGLYIFKDITDLETIYNYSKEQSPVVGVVTIDNYADVVKTEEDFNDLVSKVKNEIFQYAKDFGLLLRRYRNDSYFLLCNFDALNKMREDGFSLINKVRELGAGDDIPLTLSIGIAHDFPDVVKLNDLASEAVSIAMSRGGDQVVISKYGSEMEFIGGKTEAQERRNRVKVRVLADSLISLIKGSSNVLIMGHTMMDMDALGACLGIKAICENLDKTSQIVVDFKLTEYKTRSALTSSFSRDDLDGMIISPKDAEDKVRPNTLLVVVDVHIPSMVMAPQLLDKSSKIVVIDHHRRAEEYIDSPVFNHIDPSASSSSELVTEFIHFASISPRVMISSAYATIMLSGIFLDSSYFKSKNCGIRTFEAATVLKEFGADNAIADDFLKDDFEEYSVVNEIISKMKTPVPGVVYAIAPPDQFFDNATLAKAANTCLSMKAINAAFIIGNVSNKETRMSCRSDGSINVQIIAEKMGGGGHFTSSAVSFEKTTPEAVAETLLSVLDKNLSEARTDSKKKDIQEDR